MKPSTPGISKRTVSALSVRNAEGLWAWRWRTPTAWARSSGPVGELGRMDSGLRRTVLITVHELLVGGVDHWLEGQPKGLVEVAEDRPIAAEMDGQSEQGPLRAPPQDQTAASTP